MIVSVIIGGRNECFENIEEGGRLGVRKSYGGFLKDNFLKDG